MGNRLDAEIVNRQKDVSTEANTREAADNALSSRINNIVAPQGEVSLAEVVDARLNGFPRNAFADSLTLSSNSLRIVMMMATVCILMRQAIRWFRLSSRLFLIL